MMTREEIKQTIFDWIRDDLEFAAKATIYPMQIDRLVDRLQHAQREAILAVFDRNPK